MQNRRYVAATAVKVALASIVFGPASVVAQAFAQDKPRDKPAATLYRNPNCDCCLEYAKYLRGNGFEVTVDSKQDLASIRKQLHVSEQFEGCHVTVIGRYAVEGHVSVSSINKLLAEHPDIAGISLPGMPRATPGMTGIKRGPFTIYEVGCDAAPAKVFAVE